MTSDIFHSNSFTAMLQVTTEDLIRYLYKETLTEENGLIEDAMRQDWKLNERYLDLQNMYAAMDNIVVCPRPQSVTSILNYAKKTVATV